MKRLVVILVDWNGVEVTRECLRSLRQAQLPPSLQLEIIVVDNGSAIPLTESLGSEFSSITIVRSESNLGFTGGNNWGIEKTLPLDPDFLLFLNNDTVVSDDFLLPLLHFLETHPKVSAVQPRICFYPEQKIIWNAGNKFHAWITQTGIVGYGKKDDDNYVEVKEQPWLTGCAILARAELFKGQEGLRFNDRFFALYEDVDLSFRIRNRGGKLFYVPESLIYHRAGYSSNSKTKTREGYTHPMMVFLNSRNRIWLARLYTPIYFWPTTFLYLSVYFLLLIPYFLLRGRFKKAFFVIKAIKQGIFSKPV